MSSETGSDTPPSVLDANAVHSGRCKWFNNKAGYGFLTVVRSTDDTMVGKDVFAHHTGITVNNEQYRYLVQGEYVDFSMKETNSGDHKIQASDITGIAGGQLMCETRFENRKQQEENGDGEDGERRQPQRRRQYGRGLSTNRASTERCAHELDLRGRPRRRRRGPNPKAKA